MPTQVIMPQLGESVVEGTVTRWLKQVGEPVQEMEALLEINTDKVDTEIPSPAEGILLKILTQEGETVRAGTVIAWLGKPGEEPPGGPGDGGTTRTAVSTGGETAAAETADAAVRMADVPKTNGQQGNHPAASPAPGRHRELGFISPIVARLAQEHNLDLTLVSGTGEGGRITKKDVLGYLEKNPAAPAGQPAPDAKETPGEEAGVAAWETPADGDLFRPTEMVFGQKVSPPASRAAQTVSPAAAEDREAVQGEKPGGQPAAGPAPLMPGEGRVAPLSAMRRRIAEHMVISKRTAPHVTTVMEANLYRVMAHYRANQQPFAQDGVRLTYTAYFASAVVQALRAFPLANSSWTEDGILIHQNVNLGIAVSLGEEGLIVPVIKGADNFSLMGLARAIGDLAGRARGHDLQPEDVRDGTFTITNHGISGSLFATPVINQPQCGILGVGLIEKRVVVLEDEAGGDTIAIRPMVYLSFTFDHRILDGASADGFLAKVKQTLEDWK